MKLSCTNHSTVSSSSDLVIAVEEAIAAAEQGDVISPNIAHERIKKMYTWDKVARRTEKVLRSCVIILSFL